MRGKMRHAFSMVASVGTAAMLGCGGGSGQSDAPAVAKASPPPVIGLHVIGATIGPGKADGTTWDGLGRLPQDFFAELQRELRRPRSELPEFGIEMAVRAVQLGVEKPDPVGWAEIDRGQGAGFGERQALGNGGAPWKDTFTPTWLPPAVWSHVLVHERVVVRVQLHDHDLMNHDPIALVHLNGQDIQQAIAQIGHVSQISVGTQSGGQLMNVAIAALREQ